MYIETNSSYCFVFGESRPVATPWCSGVFSKLHHVPTAHPKTNSLDHAGHAYKFSLIIYVYRSRLTIELTDPRARGLG